MRWLPQGRLQVGEPGGVEIEGPDPATRRPPAGGRAATSAAAPGRESARRHGIITGLVEQTGNQ